VSDNEAYFHNPLILKCPRTTTILRFLEFLEHKQLAVTIKIQIKPS
jgi:hypothetical protein